VNYQLERGKEYHSCFYGISYKENQAQQFGKQGPNCYKLKTLELVKKMNLVLG